eukprot:356133-Chlamydomonas_euryale.AAC.24
MSMWEAWCSCPRPAASHPLGHERRSPGFEAITAQPPAAVADMTCHGGPLRAGCGGSQLPRSGTRCTRLARWRWRCGCPASCHTHALLSRSPSTCRGCACAAVMTPRQLMWASASATAGAMVEAAGQATALEPGRSSWATAVL